MRLDTSFKVELACGLRRAAFGFESHRSGGQAGQRLRGNVNFKTVRPCSSVLKTQALILEFFVTYQS